VKLNYVIFFILAYNIIMANFFSSLVVRKSKTIIYIEE